MNKLLVAAGTLVFPVAVLGHGGGLDSSGCHTNRKTGGYHCHRGNGDGGSGSSNSGGTSAAQRPAPSAPNPGSGPTCYTGPRGGTYTITPSGRKNYKGC
jgi:hypothetical protein